MYIGNYIQYKEDIRPRDLHNLETWEAIDKKPKCEVHWFMNDSRVS